MDDFIKSSFEAKITKDDYTLSFDKIAGTLCVFLIDNKMPTTLLVYTQHFPLPFPDTIQYGEDLDTLEEKKGSNRIQHIFSYIISRSI